MSEKHLLISSTSMYLIQLIFKGFSAFFVGITAALIFHTIFNYSVFGFVFIGVIFAGLVLKFLGQSTLLRIFLFDLAFLFLLLLLKFYIKLAPNI